MSVNEELTPKRRTSKRRATRRETPEYAAMLRRMLRAYGRRVGDSDDVDLTEMAELRDVLENAISEAVAALRARGESWAYIGAGLRITRQGAQQRYGRQPGVDSEIDAGSRAS